MSSVSPGEEQGEQERIVAGIEWFTVDRGDGFDDEDCQCARCGSSTAFVGCWQCSGEGGLGSDCIDDLCHGGECIHGDSGQIRCDICRGQGGWWCCISGPEWCNANPMPGRENVVSTALKAEAWNDV